MGLFSWLSNVLGYSTFSLNGDPWCSDPNIEELLQGYAIRELAFDSAANMIANSMSKCEFRTFEGKRETKGREYYLWNVEPNRNQSSSEFIHKLVYHLLRHNEALVVEMDRGLQVAESFQRKPYALFDDLFTDVTVAGLTLSRTFQGSEVLYFQLNNNNVKKLTDAIFESYSKVIAYGMKAYQQSRGRRGVLKVDGMFQGDEAKRKETEERIKGWFDTYFNSDNAVLPLPNGYEYKENETKVYASESTRDIRALIDDVSDFTCKAFGIPPSLLRGNVEGLKDAMDMYLTFCIDPLADLLSEGINRKRNGYAGFEKGRRLLIDTTRIRHIDIFTVAPSLEKMISSGVQSVNDIRRLLDEPLIDEDWADQHFITRNFTTFTEAMAPQGGGADA